MRSILLIARREYLQYVLSRGFLLFLVMFPLAIMFGGAALGIVESARPVRNFVVIDRAGGYETSIDRSLDEDFLRDEFRAYSAWLAAALDPQFETDDLPAASMPGAPTRARVLAFHKAGGVEAARAAAAGFLRSSPPPYVSPRRSFARLAPPDAALRATDRDATIAAMAPFLAGERIHEAGAKLFAAIYVPQGFGDPDGPQAEYWSENLTDSALEDAVSRALSDAQRRRLADDYGLDAARLDALDAVDAPLEAFQPSSDGAIALDGADRVRSAVLPAALTYMLLVVVFGVGNLLLTNTIEERSNKVVEVLLSSVTAEQLMLGKLLGVAAVGLTMPTIMMIGGLAASLAGVGGGAIGGLILELLTSSLIWIYLFYFFCAYWIFAMIFLAIGSVSNSLQDAQSYLGPVMILVFAPLPFMMMVFQNPNGLVASILTWIPVYTPYAVMMRAAADPPMGEIIGATALMLAFAIVFARYMGRIFKAGLLQSAPPKAKDLVAIARASER
jgi:ABC-2 type transport system permease protein